jgi:hypothetical protein
MAHFLPSSLLASVKLLLLPLIFFSLSGSSLLQSKDIVWAVFFRTMDGIYVSIEMVIPISLR